MSKPSEKLAVTGKDPTSRFRIIFSNLPLGERKLVIVVLDDQPISWDMAKREIEQGTELGKKIISKLEQLQII